MFILRPHLWGKTVFRIIWYPYIWLNHVYHIDKKYGYILFIFYSFRHYGIYDHFRTNVKSYAEKTGPSDTKARSHAPYTTIQIIPRFLFGIPYEKIQKLYGTNDEEGSIDLSRLPIVGLFSDTPTYDRFIIQAYMNLVTMSVIFLLWANNPPETLMGNRPKKPQAKTNGFSSRKPVASENWSDI